MHDIVYQVSKQLDVIVKPKVHNRFHLAMYLEIVRANFGENQVITTIQVHGNQNQAHIINQI